MQKVGKRLNLCGQVTRNIGSMIMSGELQPGDPVAHADDLCEQYGVSRTVIREAVRSLAAKGLLQSKPKRGTVVCDKENWNFLDPDIFKWCLDTDPDRGFLFHLTELRKAIEPLAAAVVAQRASVEVHDQITAAYEMMEKAADDVEAFLDADIMFHTQILRAANNPLFGPMTNVICSSLKSSLVVTNRQVDENIASLPFHHEIAVAISNRESQRASVAMLTSLNDSVERLSK